MEALHFAPSEANEGAVPRRPNTDRWRKESAIRVEVQTSPCGRGGTLKNSRSVFGLNPQDLF